MSDKRIQTVNTPSKNLELFASVARFLDITEGFSIHTHYRFKDRENFGEDEEICSFSFGGYEIGDPLLDSDVKRLETLLDNLSTAGLATNSYYAIEEESRDEGDYQLTWDFEIPLIENFREPAYLNETLDSLLNQPLKLTGFESRINNFYQYGLQQVSTLISCKHKFKDKDSYSEVCIKCNNEIWSPSEFIELFHSSDEQSQRLGLLQHIQDIYLKMRGLFKR
jgi:hypothetical protein